MSQELNSESEYGEIRGWIYGIGCASLVSRHDLTVSEWADRYRILARDAAREPGPWRTDRTPYLRDIMDALSDNSGYRIVVFLKGAQLGGTELGLNWVGYTIDVAPAQMMVVWPTKEDIKSNVRIRIDPLIESTPSIAEKVTEAAARDAANNTFLKQFAGGFLAFAGANSTAQLRSKPVKKLFLDEIDEYPQNANQQGDPLDLAAARTRTFGSEATIFFNSTPTLKGSSRIEAVYQTTDMRRYYVQCPFCKVYQVLSWDQIRYETSRPDLAWYECPHCAGRIENHHKATMLPGGEWRPERDCEIPGRIGFELSALYSPVGMFSWGDCAVEYEKAKDNPQKMQVFVNTILGQSYEKKGERPEWDRLYMRRGGYELGTVPEGVLLITAGIDVQKDRIEAEVVGWGRGKQSWSLGYYVFPGDTGKLDSEAWDGLRDFLTMGFAHPAAGVVMPINRAAIDSGYETSTVYNFARGYEPTQLIVTKGSDSLVQPVGIPRSVDVKLPNGKIAKRAIKYYPVGVSHMKHELYTWLRLEKQETGKAPPGYCHFPEYGEEFFRQITAETFVRHESHKTHEIRGEWKKIRERNEALDCRIYARAAAASLRIDLFSGPQWERLEQSLGISAPEAAPAQTSGATTGPRARQERRRYRSTGIKP